VSPHGRRHPPARVRQEPISTTFIRAIERLVHFGHLFIEFGSYSPNPVKV
jgi:hypothetical protein